MSSPGIAPAELPAAAPARPRSFHLVTLGCPKNDVDSDKLAGTLTAQGYHRCEDPALADLVVVNTCAFIEAARQESVDTILELAETKRAGAELVVTGCMAERYGTELADALGEVDRVAPFGASLTGTLPVHLGPVRRDVNGVPRLDLLRLPRPAAERPWAYVKVAEGCDRRCGFCAIPSFRGPQRSRDHDELLAEVEALDVREVVLVAQDLASYGRDLGRSGAIVGLVEAVAARVDWVRLLYLYPSDLDDRLVDAILATGVPYFDLSLQHVSRPLLGRMRRWGDGARFAERIGGIRAAAPGSTFRSNFIVGYPGETEDDHGALCEFVEAVRLDWCGFFAYSREEGTYAAGLEGSVDPAVVAERLSELTELQDRITAEGRRAMIGQRIEVLVDEPGVARSRGEAPEIDGIVAVPDHLPAGDMVEVLVVDSAGPDLHATADPLDATADHVDAPADPLDATAPVSRTAPADEHR